MNATPLTRRESCFADSTTVREIKKRSERCDQLLLSHLDTTRQGKEQTPAERTKKAKSEETNLHTTSRDLLSTNQVLIQIILVETKNGVDDHLGEEGLLGVDELGGHGGRGELDQVGVEDSELGGKYGVSTSAHIVVLG